MNKLLLTMALIATINAETWKCSTLITTDDDGTETFHEISSDVTVKGKELTLSIKGVSPRLYLFSNDTLDGNRFYKLTKGKGMVLIGKVAPDLIAVKDGLTTYMMAECVAQ